MKCNVYSASAIALALTAAAALPAFAEDPSANPGSTASQTAPSSSQAAPSPSTTATGTTTEKQTEKQADTAGRTASAPDRNRKGSEHWDMAALMESGGIDTDQLQFDMLDTHIRMLERAANELRRLSSGSDQNAGEVLRWNAVRDENADHIADVVANYFLRQRLIPIDMQQAMLSRSASRESASSAAGSSTQPGQTPSSTQPGQAPSAQGGTADREQAGIEGTQANAQGRQAYNDVLETAHKMLVQSYLAKQTSDPEHVQQLRTLAAQLKQKNSEAQRQVQTFVRENKISTSGRSASQTGNEPSSTTGNTTGSGTQPGTSNNSGAGTSSGSSTGAGASGTGSSANPGTTPPANP